MFRVDKKPDITVDRSAELEKYSALHFGTIQIIRCREPEEDQCR
ncbi:hypothetical protein SFHH103_03460 [Sinorhizobium fredii HH103]|uniref:Uncharacterized protein n=1 Tax=Sinorhizobium fredii (strain HH103) TaxID=1117943 RepID=G9A3K3_SINF1|nr:hypothetical protein SFHH103_03460 [Sinorhizobium fredii HH103]